jgi:hypothetical protein
MACNYLVQQKKVLLKKVPIKKGTLVFNAGDRRHFFCKQRMEASVDQGIYIWGGEQNISSWTGVDPELSCPPGF